MAPAKVPPRAPSSNLCPPCGPHKTGTTSLQNALLTEYGSQIPQRVWYPKPIQFGPGHAEVAWSVLGRKGYGGRRPAIRQLIEEAMRCGCTRLILSAEDFASAYQTKTIDREQSRIFIEQI